MEFSMLAIRTTEDDDGRLYPVPGEDKGSVRSEQWDGEPLRLGASAVTVQELRAGTWRTLQRLRNVKLDVLITSSRVVVSCSKYDKGGGWIGFGGGGVAFAMAANGVSKARAAHRRHGKLRVGRWGQMSGLSVLCIILSAAAFVDAVRRPASQWVQADRNKGFWLTMIVLLNILGVVAYVVGVVPRLGRGTGASDARLLKSPGGPTR
jgi:hypothetical protein